MPTVEERVLAAINMDDLLAFLNQMVSFPSLGGNESDIQRFLAGYFQSLGMEVDVWDIDFAALSQHPAYSIEVERAEGLGVVGTMGSGEGKSLILNGHIDVVPAGDLNNWHYPPFQATVADGKVYGRGALDMKGGLACAIFAAKAIHDAGVNLKGKLMIESVIAEEDGGVGTLATVARGYKADAAVIMEPTELKIAPAHAGALNFRIVIPGLAAHGAVRIEGVDPIAKFIPIYQAIMKFEAERNPPSDDPLFNYPIPYPICVGTLQAGNWASTVAESLTFEGRYGIAVGEDIPTARKSFEAVIAQAAQADEWLHEHPPTVEWWGGQFEPAQIPADHPIVTTVGEAFTDITSSAPTYQGMPYGADMRLLINNGDTPTLMFGPGNVRKAHQPDEYVPVNDLAVVVRTLALTALRFCGYEE
ncbi:MAG: ArgE/DapE family deacylase [Chloroflexi bacterium]|nr:ArgE/DapE family deacylase [Chloroflexota bacterium]MCC6894742.1 ArgE/DapE family deacylase [Anaerolineae bacterium]